MGISDGFDKLNTDMQRADEILVASQGPLSSKKSPASSVFQGVVYAGTMLQWHQICEEKKKKYIGCIELKNTHILAL